MKKRTIARMMAAVMAVSMLAGCGDSDGDTAKKVNLEDRALLKWNPSRQYLTFWLMSSMLPRARMKGYLSKPVNIGKFEEMLYEVWSSHNREFSVLR